MIAKRLKVIRMDKKISVRKIAQALNYPYHRIQEYEIREGTLDKEIIQMIADYLNVTYQDIDGYCEIEFPDGANTRNYEYKLIDINPPAEKIEEFRQYVRKKHSENARNCRTTQEKINQTNEKKKSEFNIKPKGKPFECLNQACPLNKNCMCDNPVVIRGSAPCYGRNKVQDKPKKQNFIDTKSCFMADAVSKEEKEKHYAL